MKRCTKCREEKAASEFQSDAQKRTGLSSRCKACLSAGQKARLKLHPGESTKYVQAWRAKNPERAKALNAPSEKRRAIDRERYRNTPGRKEAVNRRLKELNKRRPEIKNAIIARRRALQKKALVPWADKAAMREMYAVAKQLERTTGIKHHVDHIVPLQSQFVCGLHCEGNLQVLPAFLNHQKLNRHWPDMP